MADVDYSTTMAGDQALMEALTVIDKNAAQITHLETKLVELNGQVVNLTGEKELLRKQVTELTAMNERLKESVASASAGGGGGSDQQIKELIRINHQWDLEYKEQEEAFHQYRIDSQRAQHENQTYIAKLKEEKDYQAQEISSLKRDLRRVGSGGDSQLEIAALRREISQYEKIIATLKQKNHELEEQGYTGAGRHGDGYKKKQMEEEISLLKQQVTAYSEDFEAERRDRERLVEEKQSQALRHEAEITSLRLQLDRCRNELMHYTTEATRLAQQLRLKNQFEEDQYKRHLESRGYVSRGSNGTLPPLDPYVEHDPPTSHNAPTIIEPPRPAPRKHTPPTRRDNHSNHLLARSSDVDDAHSAPASIGNEYSYQPPMESRRSASPQNFKAQPYNPPLSKPNGYSNGYGESQISNGQQNGYPDATYPAFPPRGQSPLANGVIMQNGGVVQQPYHPRRVEIDGNNESTQQVNGISNNEPVTMANSSPTHVSKDGAMMTNRDNAISISRPEEAHKVPPMHTKGRHKCPRCARRFQTSGECDDHKARCIS